MKQIKFETEAEIMAVIDEATRAMKASEQEALLCERMEKKYLRDAASASNGDAAFLTDQAGEQREKRGKALRRASRIQEKLRHLKEALSAFRTTTMPFVDQSVVLEKLRNQQSKGLEYE